VGVPGILDKRKDVIGASRHDGVRGVAPIGDFEQEFFSSSFMVDSKVPRGSLAEPVHAHTNDREALRRAY